MRFYLMWRMNYYILNNPRWLMSRWRSRRWFLFLREVACLRWRLFQCLISRTKFMIIVRSFAVILMLILTKVEMVLLLMLLLFFMRTLRVLFFIFLLLIVFLFLLMIIFPWWKSFFWIILNNYSSIGICCFNNLSELKLLLD